MPRPRSALLLGLLTLAALAGCAPAGPAGKTGAAADGKAKYKIGVIPKGTTNEFWNSVHAGAVNAAMELGDVEIVWQGPQVESDLSRQIEILQALQTKGVDGVCLAPIDSQALVPYVAEADEAGIPVVIFDSGLADDSHVAAYAATDNYRGGRLAADRLAETLGGKGNVVMLRYSVGSESTEQRETGFLDALKEKHPGVNVLSSDQYAGETAERAYAKATQVLSRFKDEVDGVFAVNESNADGVFGAIRELGLAGKVKFVAFDPNPNLIRGLKDGQVHGIVLQDPVTMGYASVKALHAKLTGEPVEKRVRTGEYVATPENMDDPQIKKLLFPTRFGG